MQETVDCDNNRTPVIFRGTYIYHFVEGIGKGQLEAYARVPSAIFSIRPHLWRIA